MGRGCFARFTRAFQRRCALVAFSFPGVVVPSRSHPALVSIAATLLNAEAGFDLPGLWRPVTSPASTRTTKPRDAPASGNGLASLPSLARPFVKWAGGKTQILSALRDAAPREVGTYFEPFVGGGALFFALASDELHRPRRAVLNDLSPELMVAFQIVRDDPQRLIEQLDALAGRYLAADAEARKALYYAVREEQPEAPVEAAARMIFLNKTCFNGLYRVNRRGRFNVPHGRYRRPKILDVETLLAASAALRDVELLCVDFERACEGAAPGDLVYLDPPFYPLSVTSSFTAYTEEAFGREDQLRLKWLVDDLTARGVDVMLSNSPHQWVLGLYEGGRYDIARIPARRVINSRGDRRSAIDELLVTNAELAARSRAASPAG